MVKGVLKKQISLGYNYSKHQDYALVEFSIPPRPSVIRQAIREVLPREVCKGDWWASGSGYEGRY